MDRPGRLWKPPRCWRLPNRRRKADEVRHLVSVSILDTLTSPGVDHLRGLGVRSIVDLRTADERVSPLPWNHDGAVGVLALPSANPAGESLRVGSYDPGILYVDSIEDRRRDLPVILSLLADEARLPVVIACSGGKDRTGMFVALILGVLGVPEDTIVEDHAMSDEFMTRDPRAYALALEGSRPLVSTRRCSERARRRFGSSSER